LEVPDRPAAGKEDQAEVDQDLTPVVVQDMVEPAEAVHLPQLDTIFD